MKKFLLISLFLIVTTVFVTVNLSKSKAQSIGNKAGEKTALTLGQKVGLLAK